MIPRGGGHGHHHRSRDYSWSREEADRFLEEASFEAGLRYPPIARLVAEAVPPEREGPAVLDLGCGPALLLPHVSKMLPGARLVGIEPSKDMLELARRYLEGFPQVRYELKEGRAEAIPVEDGSVDVVVALKNLHEWEDAPRGMSEVARVLRPGGTFVLRDSNRAYPYWRLRLLVAWRRLRWGRLGVRGYLGPYPDAYRPREVDVLLQEAGLRVSRADRRSVEFLYVATR